MRHNRNDNPDDKKTFLRCLWKRILGTCRRVPTGREGLSSYLDTHDEEDSLNPPQSYHDRTKH